MGGLFSKKITDGQKAPDENNHPGGAPKHTGGQTHAIVACLDYGDNKYAPEYTLTSTKDGKNFLDLLRACGVNDITSLFDHGANTAAVIKAIRDVGSRCKPGDYFVFYYSGHGAQVKNNDGTELSGFDSALCLVEPGGAYFTPASYMIDDDFSKHIIQSINEDVKVIVLTDCCHSGSIADLDAADWGNIHACAFAGCLDNQESNDTGNGGVFTHSMLMAISKFSGKTANNQDYSCAQLYNATLKYDYQNYGDSTIDQTISISNSDALGCPSFMAWPLIPHEHYSCPLPKTQGAGNKILNKTGKLLIKRSIV